MKHVLLRCMLTGLIGISTVATAEDPVLLAEAAPADGAPADWRGSMDASHADLSREVISLGRRLDRLFGGPEYEREVRGSVARVSLTTLFEEDDIELQPSVRFKFALPRTEKRLSLILESEDESGFPLPGQRRPIQYNPNAKERYIAGLQYVRNLAELWNFDADAGVRLRWPPEAFTRARVARSVFMDLWEFRVSQAAFWKSGDGVGATTEFLAQRPLPGPRFFRSETEATWLHDEAAWFYGQDFSVSHEFTPLHAIQARLGVRGESQPTTRVTKYFVNVGWRRNVYRDWLFLEIRPELLFEREDDFRAQPRLFVVLEAFFGDVEWPALGPDAAALRAPAGMQASTE